MNQMSEMNENIFFCFLHPHPCPMVEILFFFTKCKQCGRGSVRQMTTITRVIFLKKLDLALNLNKEKETLQQSKALIKEDSVLAH